VYLRGDGTSEYGEIGTYIIEKVKLNFGEYEINTVLETEKSDSQKDIALLADGSFLLLNLTITKELEEEGYTRDVIREVQEHRKKAGLDVTDRIALTLGVPAGKEVAIDHFQELLCQETLTTKLSIHPAPSLTITVDKV
jgi:isoleucyl-tRNA synthetase